MKKVAIVTDSSAYLPPEIVSELGIHVVPLTLQWDGESYRDGEDIRAEEFYERLAKSDTIPTTSQVTVGEFDQLFKSLLDQDYAVFAMLISSGISGTVESAIQAKEAFKDAPLEVMDSAAGFDGAGFHGDDRRQSGSAGREPGRMQSAGGRCLSPDRGLFHCRYFEISQ